ncbi:hypothetical protein D3C79_946020 [compost metagenome]
MLQLRPRVLSKTRIAPYAGNRAAQRELNNAKLAALRYSLFIADVFQLQRCQHINISFIRSDSEWVQWQSICLVASPGPKRLSVACMISRYPSLTRSINDKQQISRSG